MNATKKENGEKTRLIWISIEENAPRRRFNRMEGRAIAVPRIANEKYKVCRA